MPAEQETLETEVQELIEEQLARVRAKPKNAEEHAALAIVYEANDLWETAAAAYASAIQLDGSEPLYVRYNSILAADAGDGADGAKRGHAPAAGSEWQQRNRRLLGQHLQRRRRRSRADVSRGCVHLRRGRWQRRLR